MKLKFQSNAKTVLFAVGFSIIAGMILFLICFNIASPDIVEAKSEDDIQYFKNFQLDTAGHSSYFGTDDLSEYKITVFNGWAPWCTGCIKEMPDLEELSHKYLSEGLNIVGIVPDYSDKASTSADAEEYDEKISTSISSTGVTYPVMLADEAFYDEVYPTTHNAMPTTWIVDSDGNVLDIISGAKSHDDWIKIFDQWLSKY